MNHRLVNLIILETVLNFMTSVEELGTSSSSSDVSKNALSYSELASAHISNLGM